MEETEAGQVMERLISDEVDRSQKEYTVLGIKRSKGKVRNPSKQKNEAQVKIPGKVEGKKKKGTKEERWKPAEINRFLELYELFPCLWNYKVPEYKDRNSKEHAWGEIVKLMKKKDLTVKKSKYKIRVLRNTYSNELLKIQKSKSSGKGLDDDDVYTPILRWFSTMDRIVGQVVQSRGSQSVGLPDEEGKVIPYTSECEGSNQSTSKFVSGDGSDNACLEDLLTQPNTHFRNVCQSRAAPNGISDDSSSNASLIREDQCFKNPDASGFALRQDEVGRAQKESQNDSGFAIRHEGMNVDQEEGLVHGVDFPLGALDYSLTTFGNHIINLMSRLPLEKSFQLQQKLLTITMNTIIQFEKENLLKDNNGIECFKQTNDRCHNLTPAEFSTELSRVNGPSKKQVPSRNYMIGTPSKSQKTNQVLQPNKVFSSESQGKSRVTPEISVEEFPLISQIKKEIEGFETVYCSVLPSFDSTEPVGGPKCSEVHSGDNRGSSAQYNTSKESIQASAELKRHAANPDEQNESSRKEKVAPKRPCLENQNFHQ